MLLSFASGKPVSFMEEIIGYLNIISSIEEIFLSEEAAALLCSFETVFISRVVRSRDDDAEPQRWSLIGSDHEAREIELVFVNLTPTDILIIHANYLTKGFHKEARRSMR
jgi:hypothetical protein